MLISLSFVVVAWLVCVDVVAAWGKIGHQMTGAIAERFLTPLARRRIGQLLPQWQGSLKRACTWADEIKSNPIYEWSYQLHYISGHVDPHSLFCSLDVQRDCENGMCIVQAIHNYTDRLAAGSKSVHVLEEFSTAQEMISKNALEWDEQQEALKFLVHFIGDIHQPLHTCSLYKGGNDYHVKFDNQTTFRGWNGHRMPMNLHVLWDELLLEKWIKQDYNDCQDCFLDEMVGWIKQLEKRNEWTVCSGNEPFGVCPVAWSAFTQQINCERIWVGVNGIETDLGGDYYEQSKVILKLQLAKAGYRMAHVLNRLFDQDKLFVVQS